jgi:electron transport complex protein RnfD
VAEIASRPLAGQLFQKPQVNLARSTTARMWLVNLCAFMAVIQSSLTDFFSSLLVAVAAVSAAVLTEFLILRRSGKVRSLKDGSAVASALILTLLLPNRISPAFAAAGAVFAMAVIKHSFGGLGSNWLNPAAGAWLFIRLSWPVSFRNALSASHLSLTGEFFSGGATQMDAALRSFFNNNLFSLFKVELPEGYMDLFLSRFPGIIADRGVFALLLGTIFISTLQVSRSWIPVIYLSVFSILVRLAGALPSGGEFGNGDILFALCSGGTLVAAFFLTTDPVTSAKSKGCTLLAAAVGGGLAFLFRFYGAEPYGVVFASVFVNAMLPLVRIFENRKMYERQELINER